MILYKIERLCFQRSVRNKIFKKDDRYQNYQQFKLGEREIDINDSIFNQWIPEIYKDEAIFSYQIKDESDFHIDVIKHIVLNL